MNTQLNDAFRWMLILLVGSVSFSTAQAQSPPPNLNGTASQTSAPISVADYLKNQIKLTKTGTDSTGFVILEAGSVLILQKGGVLGVLPTSSVICPSTYQDGNLKGPSAFCHAMVAQTSRYLTVGEKVYVTKIDVNVKNERVSLAILECDSCNGVTQPSSLKSMITFQFSKGYLEAADPGQVQDTIGQVLQVDSGDAGAQEQVQNGQDQNAPQSNAPAQAAQPSRFEGKWVKVSNRGVSVEIHSEMSGLSVNSIYGRADSLRADDSTLEASVVQSFATRVMKFQLEQDGRMRVETHTHFTDQSGRKDYDLIEYFVLQQ